VSFWNKLFDRAPNPTRAETAAVASFAEFARIYDPQNKQQLAVILKWVYESAFQPVQNDRDLVAVYASFASEVAIFVRTQTHVDICTLTSPLEIPPLAPLMRPLMTTLSPLEIVMLALETFIVDQLKTYATKGGDIHGRDHEAKVRYLADNARMLAAFVWKGYLYALNTEPPNWGIDAVCALSALRILSTADPTKVVEILRDGSKAAIIRTNVCDGDWPPRGYIKLYFENRDLLAGKYRAIFGAFPWGE